MVVNPLRVIYSLQYLRQVMFQVADIVSNDK